MLITNKFSCYKTRMRNDKKIRIDLFMRTKSQERHENLGTVSTSVPNIFSPGIMTTKDKRTFKTLREKTFHTQGNHDQPYTEFFSAKYTMVQETLG